MERFKFFWIETHAIHLRDVPLAVLNSAEWGPKACPLCRDVLWTLLEPQNQVDKSAASPVQEAESHRRAISPPISQSEDYDSEDEEKDEIPRSPTWREVAREEDNEQSPRRLQQYPSKIIVAFTPPFTPKLVKHISQLYSKLARQHHKMVVCSTLSTILEDEDISIKYVSPSLASPRTYIPSPEQYPTIHHSRNQPRRIYAFKANRKSRWDALVGRIRRKPRLQTILADLNPEIQPLVCPRAQGFVDHRV